MFNLGEPVRIANPRDPYFGQVGEVRSKMERSLDNFLRWRVEFRPGTWGWYDDADLQRA